MDSAKQLKQLLTEQSLQHAVRLYSESLLVEKAESKIVFNGRICIIGCGSISACLQPLILRHLEMDYSKITIVDVKKDAWGECIRAGARLLNVEITKHNFENVLGELVGSGDVLIDLAWNIDTVETVAWCQQNNILYLNTSIEVWEPYLPNNGVSPEDDTIYARHIRLEEFIERLRKTNGNNGATAIIESGANPGLVSHWTKLGLQHIAENILASVAVSKQRRLALEEALSDADFARVAFLTGTKVIHVSERDSQTSMHAINHQKEFANTWSIESYHQESVAPAELAWGTHETELPFDAIQHKSGRRNKIYLERKAIDTLVRSWVPSGEIVGQVSAHGEVFTISRHLTMTTDGAVTYRPSVYFVYRPCDIAHACIQSVVRNNYELPASARLMNEEITDGRDEVGVLLLGHDLNGWWVGSRLDIHEARRHVPGHNATTLQVAASALAALIYAIKHPNEGICVSDDLPYKELLSTSNRYLGECLSIQTSWAPQRADLGSAERWTFQSFEQKPSRLVKAG